MITNEAAPRIFIRRVGLLINCFKTSFFMSLAKLITNTIAKIPLMVQLNQR